MLRNLLALLGLLSLAGITAVTVNAQDWDWSTADRPPQMSVSFADLDLSTRDGRHTLDQRIRHAVRAICGDADPRDLPALESERVCNRDAFRSTERQIANAVQTARQRNLAASGMPARAGVTVSAATRIDSTQ